MKIRMLTNFRTARFGLLVNDGTVYDLPNEDASALIRNNRAEEARGAESEVSQEELIKAGEEKLVADLKRNLLIKKKGIKESITDKGQLDAQLSAVEARYQEQISKVKSKGK